ncbi:hypothetical protein [Paenibacillus sp. UNC499MF]|nr:hypothetical protein [Paenibacillus sp. UNC499MF]SEG37048.1 hypothetical protein SAMN02799616_02701 [Paenibacillus sp. UNC499MF]
MKKALLGIAKIAGAAAAIAIGAFYLLALAAVVILALNEWTG